MADEVSFFPWHIFMYSFILIVKHLSVSSLLGTGQTSEQDLIPSVLKQDMDQVNWQCYSSVESYESLNRARQWQGLYVCFLGEEDHSYHQIPTSEEQLIWCDKYYRVLRSGVKDCLGSLISALWKHKMSTKEGAEAGHGSQ